MKRMMNIKQILLLVAVICMGIFASCDDAKYDALDTHAYIGEALKSTGGDVTITKDTIVTLDILLSDVSERNNHYQLVVDQASLDEYNRKNGTSYVSMPEEVYKLSEDVVIEAGEYKVKDTIDIKAFTDEMNASGESYALPLRLVAKEGSVDAMPVTGSYIITASSVFEFSAPLFVNETPNLIADGFTESPETYGEYTIEVRFQISNTNARNRAVFSNNLDSSLDKILLRFEDPNSADPNHEKHSLVQIVGRNSIYLNPTRSFKPNKWQHLALTCDGSSYRLYINGEPSGSIEIPGGPTTFSDVRWFSTAWGQCKILMSEARIWSVVRTELQIQNNMKIVSPNSPGLEAYWRFNEGEGTVFEDATGNGHTIKTSKKFSWVPKIKSTDESTPWP